MALGDGKGRQRDDMKRKQHTVKWFNNITHTLSLWPEQNSKICVLDLLEYKKCKINLKMAGLKKSQKISKNLKKSRKISKNLKKSRKISRVEYYFELKLKKWRGKNLKKSQKISKNLEKSRNCILMYLKIWSKLL